MAPADHLAPENEMTNVMDEGRRAGKSFFLISAMLGVPAYFVATGATMFLANLLCPPDVATWLAITSGYLAICGVNYLLFRRSAGLLWAKAVHSTNPAVGAS